MKRLFIGVLFLHCAILAAQTTDPASTTPGCSPAGDNLCLNDSRFSVTATWNKSDGSHGQGNPVLLTGDTGYFWFFDPSNIEVTIKVLNGCGVNGDYWVFAAGLTNVGVTLNVTDTATGRSKTYTNPVNTAFVAIQDTGAFATCSTPTNQVADVTGSWAGAVTVNGFGNIASFSLLQTGVSVSGTVAMVGGGGGRLTGSVSGNIFTFSVTEVSPCPGSFNGSASISQNNFSMAGTVTGSDCGGSYSRAVTAAKTFVGGTPAQGALISGSWNATLTVGGSQYSAVMTFVQNGNVVSGTVAITGFGNGSMTGSIVDQKLTLTINELSPCLGAFLAVATNATDSSMSGPIAGSDCGGSDQGTFSATKR